MVLPVSGFLPVPLPMMIPFMGAQSLVIGKMFGEGFQYGKRKISAMSNEEFNKLTFEDMMSNARTELKASIPTINASLQDMQPMVEVVVREFFNYISLVTKTVTGTGGGDNIFQQEGQDIGESIAHALGTHIPSAHPSGAQQQIPVTPIGPQQPFKLPPTSTIIKQQWTASPRIVNLLYVPVRDLDQKIQFYGKELQRIKNSTMNASAKQAKTRDVNRIVNPLLAKLQSRINAIKIANRFADYAIWRKFN